MKMYHISWRFKKHWKTIHLLKKLGNVYVSMKSMMNLNSRTGYFILYIPPLPTWVKIIQMHHDLPTAWYFGFNKTMELISWDFWWLQMWKHVKEFIQSCNTCARGNFLWHRPYGLFHLLPLLKDPWLSLSIDFITDLPLVNENDSIFVVVNWLTKMAHFIPCNKTIIEEWTTKLFLDNIYCIHWLPNDIVLDRGLNLLLIFGKDFFSYTV